MMSSWMHSELLKNKNPAKKITFMTTRSHACNQRSLHLSLPFAAGCRLFKRLLQPASMDRRRTACRDVVLLPRASGYQQTAADFFQQDRIDGAAPPP
jgi:hypothetical protein